MWPLVLAFLATLGFGMVAGERIGRAPWPRLVWRGYLGVLILAVLLWMIAPSFLSVRTAGL